MPTGRINVAFRLDRDIHQKVKDLCSRRDESLSTFMRRAILRELARLGALDEETEKALGL